MKNLDHIALQAAEQAQHRCQYCDGTGDVHSPTGEWLGACDCESFQQAQQPWGQLLEMARQVIRDGHVHDVGGGDLAVTTCEAFEGLDAFLRQHFPEPLGELTAQEQRWLEADLKAKQAQQAEPRCACGDSFTSDAMCANCLASTQAVPAARDVLMEALLELRAAAVEQCNVLPAKSAVTVNDAFKLAYHIKRIDIYAIADRYAATASQARAIINEQAEKLSKGRLQWEQINQPAVAVPSRMSYKNATQEFADGYNACIDDMIAAQKGGE